MMNIIALITHQEGKLKGDLSAPFDPTTLWFGTRYMLAAVKK